LEVRTTFDSINRPGTVNESAGTVTASYTFTAAGVYRVTLTVTNDLGATAASTQIDGIDELVVVYDPNAGFVTGGGWIQSPAGAYPAAPALTGKANFGFVSKYLKNASVPTGETEFQFKVANFNFNSSVYEWLVVSGSKAQYKGSGTVNGAGDYGFLLTVTDGQLSGGGGVDRFRMKVWVRATGVIVYDNQIGSLDDANPTTALGGGSIIIHTNGSKPASFLAPGACRSRARTKSLIGTSG